VVKPPTQLVLLMPPVARGSWARAGVPVESAIAAVTARSAAVDCTAAVPARAADLPAEAAAARRLVNTTLSLPPAHPIRVNRQRFVCSA
jgi:hypothetical protein